MKFENAWALVEYFWNPIEILPRKNSISTIKYEYKALYFNNNIRPWIPHLMLSFSQTKMEIILELFSNNESNSQDL